jgi:hypothetical protein
MRGEKSDENGEKYCMDTLISKEKSKLDIQIPTL